MSYVWHQLRSALPLIFNRNGYVLDLVWVTLRVAFVSTAAALVIGLPIGLSLGLGRFRGRRGLQILANASLGLPPIVVGLLVLLLLLPKGVFGSLHAAYTLTGVYIAQTLLALPYIVALTPAAIQALAPGLFDQARLLGAGRWQLATLALREARLGILAAVIAAMGAALAEVGAVVVIGGNIQNYDQTLASAVLQQVNDYANYPYGMAISIVLLALVIVLLGILTVLQQRGAINLRLRPA